jgi:ribosomal protein S18
MFKKCEDCPEKMKIACQSAFVDLSLKKIEDEEGKAVVEGSAVKNNSNNSKKEEIETMTNQKNSTENTTVKTSAVNAKIGKAQQVKDAIFSMARKAEYTRKELGQAIQGAFPEYKNSTLSTYISDSFNVKYAGVTGCGAHRMLAYVKVGDRKIIVVK